MTKVLCGWIEPKFREIGILCRDRLHGGSYSSPTSTGLAEKLDNETTYKLVYGFSVGCPDLVEYDERLYAEQQCYYLVPEKHAYDMKWATFKNLSHYDGVPKGYQVFRNY